MSVQAVLIETIIARCRDYLHHTSIDADQVTMQDVRHHVTMLFPDIYSMQVLEVAGGVLAALVHECGVTVVGLAVPVPPNFAS